MTTRTPVYFDHEIDAAATPEERERMLVVNRMNLNPKFDHVDGLHTLPLATLRAMQAEVRENRQSNSRRAQLRDVELAPVAPAAKPVPRPMPAKWQPPLPAERYRATIWHKGRAIHVGYFDTPEGRDDALAQARFRVSLGLHPRDWSTVIK